MNLIGIFPETREKTYRFLNQSVPVLTGIFIFFHCFPHTTAIRQISFYLSVFIVILLIISKKTDFTFKTPLTTPLMIFILWTGLSVIWALNRKESLHDFYAVSLRYLALYFIIINFFKSKRRILFLTWIIIISVSIFSIRGLIDFYLTHENNIFSSRFSCSDCGYINRIGAITLPACLLLAHHLFSKEIKTYYKILLSLLLLVIFLTTLLTYSRGTYIAIIVSFVVLLWSNKKRLSIALLIIMICMGSLYAGSAGFRSRINYKTLLNKNERPYIWLTSLEMIKDHPVAGFGLINVFAENWMTYNAKLPERYQFKAYPFFHPHNLILDITIRLGLVGIALFFYLIFRFARMCLQIIKNGKDEFISGWGLCFTAVFVGLFVIGMFDNILRDKFLCTFSILFAMTAILQNLNESSAE